MPYMVSTPEQIEQERALFEKSVGRFWRHGFEMYPDGAGYVHKDLNDMWEGWLQSVHADRSGVGAIPAPVSSPADELRRMRQYSSAFTKAFDSKEPVFVLRGQDTSAFKCVAQWISLNQPRLGDSHPKIIAAKATMRLMMVFEPQKHPD